MDQIKANPVFLAGSAFALLLSCFLLFLYLRNGGETSPLAVAQEEPSLEDGGLDCSGAPPLEAAAIVEGQTFEAVGELLAVDRDYVRVGVATSEIAIMRGVSADIEGQFLPGDWIAASGSVDDGRLVATEFRQPCSGSPIGPAKDTPTPTASATATPARTGATTAPTTQPDPPAATAAPQVTTDPTKEPEPTSVVTESATSTPEPQEEEDGSAQ